MARKNQCLKCKDYKESQNLCTLLWTPPTYDDNECGDYHDRLVTKERESQQTTHSQNTSYVKDKDNSYSQHTDVKSVKEKKTENEEYVVAQVPFSMYKYSKYITALVLVLLFAGLFFLAKTLYRNHINEEKEDAMLVVKSYLEDIRNNRIAEFSTLNSYIYENDTLSLVFDCSRIHIERSAVDNSIEKDFMAIVTTTPEIWMDISNMLSDAAINLSVSFPAISRKISITYDTLHAWVRDSVKIKEGNEYFTKYKMDEVVDYAKIHFANDRYFRVDGCSILDDYVLLNLSFYDVDTDLGETYYDKKRVPLHFTDKVGNMGSILDGMLHVCTRTKKGLGFTYKGMTRHDKYSCIWNVEEISALKEKEGSKYLNDEKATNQVRSVIVTKQK